MQAGAWRRGAAVGDQSDRRPAAADGGIRRSTVDVEVDGAADGGGTSPEGRGNSGG